MTIKTRSILLALALCLSVVGMGNAATMKLSELVAGETITSGDKRFSDFEYAITGDMPAAEDVNVIPIQDVDGNYGIRFQGGFIDHVGGSASDALITYNVTATDPGYWISDAHLVSNVVNPDGGFGSIAETFLPDKSDPDDVLYVSTDTSLTDMILFMPPQKTFMVQKNILLSAGTKAVTMSFVDQTFSQVPEPTSLLLILTGGLSLLAFRRS